MEKYHDVTYLKLLKQILEEGVVKTDRTGTGTLSVFGTDMRFDLSDMSIPLLTTKKMNINSIIHELIWFISGNTNTKYLRDNNVKIWDLWADDNGDLGPIYGAQWRDCNGIDQLQEAINLINDDPNSRRIIVDSWNVAELSKMQLPPCHCYFQFYVTEYSYDDKLELLYSNMPRVFEEFDIDKAMKDYQIPKGSLKCKLVMRSNDVFLGNPFNIVQYSILTHMVAQITGYEATEFIYSGCDTHIYLDHIEPVKTQLSRDPYLYESATLILNEHVNSIDDFGFDDVVISNYKSYPRIKANVSK